MKASYWILGSLLMAGAAHAQTDQSQLVQPQAASQLNSNLARLASNPRDVTALIGAGEAALELDDARAAAGFFARADSVTPNNGRVKAGLGRVMLKLQNPAEALRQFDLAGKSGYPEATILSDRALAKDMTGDQAGAQRDYQAALKATPNDDELVRRYAASLGISGQVEASDKVLQPLLYKSDRAAWRYRAFILAMNNRQAEAKKIADQTLPAQLAAAIVPYMQKMPYLTGAQKAAALHFGHFPQRVGTSIAAIVPTSPAPVGSVPPPAATSLTSASPDPRSQSTAPVNSRRTSRSRDEQIGDTRQSRRDATRVAQANTRATSPAATAQPTPTQPAPTTPSSQQASSVQQARTVQPVPTPPTRAQPSTTAPVSRPNPTPSSTTAPLPAPVQGPPNVETEFARPTPAASVAANASPSSTPVSSAAPQPTAPTPRQQPNPEATRTLADIIRAIDVPDTERQQRVAAVDLSEIATMQAARRAQQNSAAEKAKQAALAKAKAEAAAKAKKEAEEKKRLADNPSRNWLQVGTGASKGALAFTMKGLRKKFDSLSPQEAWTASWGRTNRLLVGPFPSFARAKTLESKLKSAGADVFAWQSDAGEVVEKLGSN